MLPSSHNAALFGTAETIGTAKMIGLSFTCRLNLNGKLLRKQNLNDYEVSADLHTPLKVWFSLRDENPVPLQSALPNVHFSVPYLLS